MVVSYRCLGKELELAPLQYESASQLEGSRGLRQADVQRGQPWRLLQLQQLHYSPLFRSRKLRSVLSLN